MNNNPRRPMLGLPYVAGLSEQFGRIYKSRNIHIYYKLVNTRRSMLVHPKDKTPKEHRRGTIYNITCDIDSSHTYREHSARDSKNIQTWINQQEQETIVGPQDTQCPRRTLKY